MTKYEEFLKAITVCPFCENNNRRIFESKECFLTFALWPYHQHHLLVIPKRHIESLSELTETEKEDIDSMQEKALEILKKLGYSSITHLVREGKDNKAINHVHFHTIPNIRIGDLDHYGQERKELSENDIQKTIEDIKGFL
jgi:histidine triad (HIT) family protein